MPYIGNPIYQSAFVTDTFSGNGTTTAFTMSVAPAGVSNVLIAISGVLQDPATYGVVGNTLNFSQAPPTGTNNISCRYLGVPATGVTTTAYRTQTEFTATAGQTTFSVPSYTPGFIDVYRNGVLLSSTNFVATNGTTVVLNNAASAGDLIETISFLVSSVLNAIPATAGAVGSSNIANGVTINFADGSASTPSITNDGDTNTGMFFPAADTIAFSEGGVEAMRLDSAGNVGIGNSIPSTFNAAANRLVVGNGGQNQGLTIYSSPTGYGGIHFAGGITGDEQFRGIIYYQQSNDSMQFWTSATERMRINANGLVTTPSQPCFSATRNAGNLTGGTVVVFNTVAVNVGGHYNASNGRFTAPVTGQYLFSIYGMSNDSIETWVIIFKNGSAYNNNNPYSYSNVSGTKFLHISATVIMPMNAGDYAEIYAASSFYATGNSHNGFSGCLLG